MNYHQIAEIIKEEDANFEKINIGTSNDIFHSQKSLIRIKKENETDKDFNTPQNEINLYKSLNNLDCIPKILFIDKEGNKAEEYIKGTLFNKEEKKDIFLLANSIKKLHASPIFDNTPNFRIEKRLAKYKNGLSLFSTYEKEITKKGINILEGSKQAISHNDLWKGNIIIANEKAYLIDFEFGGVNSYLFDLASFIEENRLSKENEEYFLSIFFLTDKEKKDIKTLILFLDIFWGYWAYSRYSESKNENFYIIFEEKRNHFLKKVL
ncbi:MAG TPA: hypothetical protein DCR94_01930 [Firmicutes bacterium]|nr:hypothetical protein [Bacillota bacterium]